MIECLNLGIFPQFTLRRSNCKAYVSVIGIRPDFQYPVSHFCNKHPVVLTCGKVPFKVHLEWRGNGIGTLVSYNWCVEQQWLFDN